MQYPLISSITSLNTSLSNSTLNRHKRSVDSTMDSQNSEDSETSESLPNTDCIFKIQKYCNIPSNITRQQWDRRKARMDLKIQKLKGRILAIKDIRKKLRENKPNLEEILADEEMENECKCDRPRPYSKDPLR